MGQPNEIPTISPSITLFMPGSHFLTQRAKHPIFYIAVPLRLPPAV